MFFLKKNEVCGVLIFRYFTRLTKLLYGMFNKIQLNGNRISQTILIQGVKWLHVKSSKKKAPENQRLLPL